MRRPVAVLLAAALSCAGCVQRALVVETDPPGAEVWIDGENVGLSPVRVAFDHYGRREILVSKGGFALERGTREVEPPWYERFPIDFIVENLWPGRLRDERYFLYTLRPEAVPAEEVLDRARGFRPPPAGTNP